MRIETKRQTSDREMTKCELQWILPIALATAVVLWFIGAHSPDATAARVVSLIVLCIAMLATGAMHTRCSH